MLATSSELPGLLVVLDEDETAINAQVRRPGALIDHDAAQRLERACQAQQLFVGQSANDLPGARVDQLNDHVARHFIFGNADRTLLRSDELLDVLGSLIGGLLHILVEFVNARLRVQWHAGDLRHSLRIHIGGRLRQCGLGGIRPLLDSYQWYRIHEITPC